jgi:hypothetical protein
MPWDVDAVLVPGAAGGGARAALSAAAPSAEEALAWLEGVCPGASRQARPPQLTRLELRPILATEAREPLTLDLRPLPGLQALHLMWPWTKGWVLGLRLATAAPPGAAHAALRELRVTCGFARSFEDVTMGVGPALLEHLAAEVRARAGGGACLNRGGRASAATTCGPEVGLPA